MAGVEGRIPAQSLRKRPEGLWNGVGNGVAIRLWHLSGRSGGLVNTVFSPFSPLSGDSGLQGVGATHGQFLRLCSSLLLPRTCPFLRLFPTALLVPSAFGVDLTLYSSLVLDVVSKVAWQHGFEVRPWFQSQFCLLAVKSGKVLNFFRPPFPHLKNEDSHNTPWVWVYSEIGWNVVNGPQWAFSLVPPTHSEVSCFLCPPVLHPSSWGFVPTRMDSSDRSSFICFSIFLLWV